VNRETWKTITTRALAFAGTFVFSLALVSGLPNVKHQRQRYFAQAAMDGSVARMRLLHLAGAAVNPRADCCSPLFLAASQGRIAAARYLVSEGADVNAREKLGDTPLTEAVFYGQVAMTKELLLQGADVNALGNRGTALDIAIDKKNADLADLLRHYGGKRANELR
jgi:ankyrin repeat protein